MKAALLVFSSILASMAILWGALCVASILWPGPSGEWAGLGVFFAAIVDVPAGVLALITALVIKGCKPQLRYFCLIASVVALFLPVLADILWKSHIQLNSLSGF